MFGTTRVVVGGRVQVGLELGLGLDLDAESWWLFESSYANFEKGVFFLLDYYGLTSSAQQYTSRLLYWHTSSLEMVVAIMLTTKQNNK